MLVEAPVAFNTFLTPSGYFRDDRIAGSLYQGIIVCQQAFDKYVSCQPDFILPRHAETGVIHYFHSFFEFVGCHLHTEQQESRPERFRDADLVIPPVLANRFHAEPITERLMNNRREAGRPGARRSFGMIEFCQFQYTVGMLLGIPSGAFGICIVDIRPGTVFIYTLHISFDLLHIEGIPLMQFHNDLIRHFRLRRDTGQYAVE